MNTYEYYIYIIYVISTINQSFFSATFKLDDGWPESVEEQGLLL
jgi:hypothetical protein